MDKLIKEQWVAALRSGQYKQATGQLRSCGYYCCLGVLTDLYCKATNQDWDNLGFDTQELLPTLVQEWAGISDDDIEITYYCDDADNRTLSDLNDSGLNFCQIADLIEERVP